MLHDSRMLLLPCVLTRRTDHDLESDSIWAFASSKSYLRNDAHSSVGETPLGVFIDVTVAYVGRYHCFFLSTLSD